MTFASQSQFLLPPELPVPTRLGVSEHLRGGGRRRLPRVHGPGLFNKPVRGYRRVFFGLQLCSRSVAPSQRLLLPPDLPLDRSVRARPSSLQATSAGLAQAPSPPAAAAPDGFARSKVGDASPHGSTSALGGRQLLGGGRWQAARDGTPCHPARSRRGFLAMGEGSPNFRRPSGVLGNPRSPSSMPGADGWTLRFRATAAQEHVCRHYIPQSCLQAGDAFTSAHR